MFSNQPEIFAYLRATVERYELRPHIRYQTEVTQAKFSETEGCWHLADRTGQHLATARVVLLATGPLNRPKRPSLPGLERFGGHTFHSAEWDANYDLTGKRVAVIGTGASAIQFIPQIAPQVGQLTVYQRSAPYVMPRPDRPFSAKEQTLFRRLPLLQKLLRHFIYWRNELGGLMFLGNETIGKWAGNIAHAHLERAIQDPGLRRKATPNYKLGCKRVLVSNDYYPSLTRPNVELVVDPIREVTATGVVTQDGVERPADVIIFGTGFVASEVFIDLRVMGREGRELFTEWQQVSPEAYHGTAVAGYPNLLCLIGPNTGLAHNSLVHVMESQVNYVLDYLRLLDKAGPGAYLDVKPEAQRRYNDEIQRKLGTTTWASGCQSWYLNSQGRNTTLLPALTATFRRATRKVNQRDFIVR